MNKKKIITGIITLASLALLAACSPQDSENQESVDPSVESSTPAAESNSDSKLMNQPGDMYNNMDDNMDNNGY